MIAKRAIGLIGSLVVVSSVWLPSTAGAGFSGDVVIDTTMPYQYLIRAGGSSPGISRSDNLACNSGSADPEEQVCPNDATYTPAQGTGGYQAWAIGLLPLYDEAGLHLECGWRNVIIWENGDWGFESEFVCWPVIGQELSGYMGVARIRMKWGEGIYGTAPVSAEPTSVLAFHPSTMTPCDPDLDGMTAECENDSDSSYVEDAGYEADLSFLDTACTVFPTRTNGPQDQLNNCFHYAGATFISDLPAAYQDTVWLDEPYVFNIGFGSGAADEIDPGYMYDIMQFFNSSGDHSVLGRIAVHSGSITMSDFFNLACVQGEGDDAYCYFGLDFASVGGPASTPNIFSEVYPLP